MMKAIIVKENKNGKAYPVISSIPKPTPKEGEVLVRVMASPLSTACRDTHTGDFSKVSKRIKAGTQTASGIEFSGIVEVDSKLFKKGDEVVAAVDFQKGVLTHAEYVTVPEAFVTLKPTYLSHVEAASMIVGILTGIEALINLGDIKEGKKVLINGASGNLGIYAVQIAKAMGANVIATSSPNHFSTVKHFGADEVVDYKSDYLKNNAFDIIFDTPGKLKYSNLKSYLNKNGVFITSNPQRDLLGFVKSIFSNKKSKFLFMGHSGKNRMVKWTELVESQKIHPVIEEIYKMDDFPNAIKHFKEKTVVGKIVIEMNEH